MVADVLGSNPLNVSITRDLMGNELTEWLNLMANVIRNN
jgi:hypothetical protein